MDIVPTSSRRKRRIVVYTVLVTRYGPQSVTKWLIFEIFVKVSRPFNSSELLQFTTIYSTNNFFDKFLVQRLFQFWVFRYRFFDKKIYFINRLRNQTK